MLASGQTTQSSGQSQGRTGSQAAASLATLASGEAAGHQATITSPPIGAPEVVISMTSNTYDFLNWRNFTLMLTNVGCTDSQGADHSHSNVSQRAGTDPCTASGSALIPMLRCSSFLAYTPNWPVALFLLLLHPPGTLYLLTFGCAKTFSLSNVT